MTLNECAKRINHLGKLCVIKSAVLQIYLFSQFSWMKEMIRNLKAWKLLLLSY